MTLSVDLARQLKTNGLQWQPKLHDFFMVPDAGLDERRFVIGDMLATLEILDGRRAITFNGAVEWALDFVLQSEAVWLPTATQLRTLLLEKIGDAQSVAMTLSAESTTIQLTKAEAPLLFSADSAEDAYAKALLQLLIMEQ